MGILIKGKCKKCGGELMVDQPKHNGSRNLFEGAEIRCFKCGEIQNKEELRREQERKH